MSESKNSLAIEELKSWISESKIDVKNQLNEYGIFAMQGTYICEPGEIGSALRSDSGLILIKCDNGVVIIFATPDGNIAEIISNEYFEEVLGEVE